jgi:hypothetical protein
MRRSLVVWMGLGVVAVSVLLAGCTIPRALPDDEARAFAAEVAATSERLLTALSDMDEGTFTAEMASQMMEASSGERFDRMVAQTVGRIGAYESAEMKQVRRQKQYWTVIYTADFAEEQDVTVRIVYEEADGAFLVTGLWFDSPKLRAAH